MFILALNIVFGCLVYEATAVCPVSSTTNPNSGICYWLAVGGQMDAATCNTTCAQDGGIIAEVPDQESQVFIMKTYGSIISTAGTWLGINDIDAELHFFTWDGYPQSYFNWMLGQPNGYPLAPLATNQDCIAMFRGHNYTWQDKPCSESHSCLCSYRSSPRCSCYGATSTITQEQYEEALKDLQVNKDSTNAAKRKLTSAKDDRPSAQAIGYVGIVIIGVTYSLPILMDVQRLCQKKKIHSK